MEPSLGHLPISFYGSGRDAEQFGDALFVETGEVTELDHFALAWVKLFEAAEGQIELNHLVKIFAAEQWGSLEVDALEFTAPFAGSIGSGIIHQNAAHRLRGKRVEMVLVLNRNRVSGLQAEVEFVDQRGWL